MRYCPQYHWRNTTDIKEKYNVSSYHPTHKETTIPVLEPQNVKSLSNNKTLNSPERSFLKCSKTEAHELFLKRVKQMGYLEFVWRIVKRSRQWRWYLKCQVGFPQSFISVERNVKASSYHI